MAISRTNIGSEMKTNTTDYKNAFIEIAEDFPVDMAEIPRIRGWQGTNCNVRELKQKNMRN